MAQGTGPTPAEQGGQPTNFAVYSGGLLVLEVTDGPGVLISGSGPPPMPGTELQRHPFLTAVAHVPEHEGTLRSILDGSSSTGDYLDRLRQAGYQVEPAP